VAADFNGDGFADLAMGASSEDVGSVVDAGSVNALYGSSCGLQPDPAICGGPDDQFWTQDSPGVQDQAEAGDHLGQSITTGDFNADGFGDLVIVVYLEDLPGAQDAGGVNVLYGSACGLQADPTCGNPDDQLWSQERPGVQDRDGKGDVLGRCAAAGDFNGDGIGDLALGAEQEDVGSIDKAGSVNVLYGSACGLQADPTCGNPEDQFWTQDSPGVKDQAETGDSMGRGVVAADFNGDGMSDLAVSVYSEDLPGPVDDAGGVDVLYGSAAGLQADAPDDQFWTQDSHGVKDQAEARDQYGKTLAVADFNADGLPDLVAGVYWESVGSVNGAGVISVLYGSTCGLQADPTCGNPDDQLFGQGRAGVQDRAELWDRFGWFG